MDVLGTMLTKRGYVKSENSTGLFDNWKMKNKDDIFVLTEINSKLTISIFKDILCKLEKIGGKHCILIYKHDITPFVKEIIKTTNIDPVIEVFSTDELIFDITTHELQPQFSVVTKDECKFDFSQIPRFRHDDPVVKFFNWPKGSIVKITPKDPRLTVSYRVVIF